MAQQLRQLEQPTRMLAQPSELEGVTQAVGADFGPGQSGPSDQGGDDVSLGFARDSEESRPGLKSHVPDVGATGRGMQAIPPMRNGR
jgi:hypothetical protein